MKSVDNINMVLPSTKQRMNHHLLACLCLQVALSALRKKKKLLQECQQDEAYDGFLLLLSSERIGSAHRLVLAWNGNLDVCPGLKMRRRWRVQKGKINFQPPQVRCVEFSFDHRVLQGAALRGR